MVGAGRRGPVEPGPARGGSSKESRPARAGERSERPERRSDARSSASSSRSGGDRPGRKSDWKRPADKQGPRSDGPGQYDGPDLPEEITGQELDRSVTGQLKGLPEKLAPAWPDTSRPPACCSTPTPRRPTSTRSRPGRAPRASPWSARRRGEAAYAAGHYAEALAELRAAKRMNGATDYLPMMADCHRALGNPEQALKLAKSPSVANFAPEAKAEMTLVEAGARRDMGQLDAALRTLELAPLTNKNRANWVVRLRYAYADTLEAAGRETDALAWFHRTHSIDSDEITDAAERAEKLEKKGA